MATSKGPGLYEFLIEAELQQYYGGFKSDLKIQNVPQLKYVTEDDLIAIGMSKPEMRRLKKYFQRHFPQNYLSKFKKLILSKREENHDPVLSISSEVSEKPAVKVPNKHIIPAEAIVVNKELGQGEFGTVQQGVWTDEEDRIQVAIKCLSRERMQNNPIEFLKEAAIMHGIDHEHIVRLYGVVLDTSSLMLVTELAPLRSLLECLKEPSLRSSFPVLALCDFAIQVCDGMQYLEQKRLIHRDLAARNILVFSKNKVKISDFGLSRALGVGKDYYQTNFNVNLKLPIAWCAPECISYLRFTSASDVWAYGVTLWEMFSYGFQPWAALTGHQILEAIDEPKHQRLEQPECCPREHFSVMLQCWNHDPNTRPRFCDLMNILPECKPEQVQAVQELGEDPSKAKRDQLVYRVGDVITVLDKQQHGQACCWKGVLNSGKTGLFNPAHTVAYLGSNLPSNKLEFVRGDGKNAYSSKRKIRPDMISGPQGDLKHTGHVGLDGAYFGDLSFLGGKNPNLPRQIVTPYKPQEDSSSGGTTEWNHCETSRTCDVTDCTPLLEKHHAEHGWMESGKVLDEPHEYHEISDDEDLAGSPGSPGSPVFNKSFDYGPSLMDEMESVLRSFGATPVTTPADRKKPPPPFSLPAAMAAAATPPASPLAEAINVKNELKEMAAKAAGRRKQATVKPISAADERTLDCAIAMANELTAKSMNDLDGCTPPESPHTPASPSKRKFSFRFPSVQKHASPRADRKNFAEQAACIPDIQALCEKLRLKSLSPTPTPPPSPRMYGSLRSSLSSLSRESSPQSSPQHRHLRASFNADHKTYLDANKNGYGTKANGQPLKLPPWDQASAEFYFARSRDLLTKIIPPLPQPHQPPPDGRYVDYEIHNGAVNGRSELFGPRLYENWRHLDTSRYDLKETLNLNVKTNASPSVIHKKEVPLTDSHPDVVLRKCRARSHLRRRSYNDRYPSSTSSDSSDSLTLSGSEQQMNHRLKMRRQRRGGSLSHVRSPQTSLNSPPPHNSFLNSIPSPRNSPVARSKFGAKREPVPAHRSMGYLPGEGRWPDRARDSSSLTFTSSNSSSLNWDEYPEFDRDFFSVSNCPPSPAPQSSLSAEAKEVYSSLVEQPAMEVQTILPVASIRLSHQASLCRDREPPPALTTFGHPAPEAANPLRLLRAGAIPLVRPKTHKPLPKVRVPPPPPPAAEEDSSQDRASLSSARTCSEDENPIPLPPRDRSRPSVSKPRHQRKYPLVIPGQESVEDDDVFYPQSPTSSVPSAPTTPLECSSLPPLPHPATRSLAIDGVTTHESNDAFDDRIATELDALDDINTDTEYNEEPLSGYLEDGVRPGDEAVEEHFLRVRRSRRFEDPLENGTRPKPNAHLRHTIAQLNQKYSEPEEGEETMRRHEEHVSCEDLLEFSAKTQAKSRGPDSDQVRIMTKVLGREVSSDACLVALDATDWNVHNAIKLAKLQALLRGSLEPHDAATCWGALSACDGDVARAASVLIADTAPPDYV